MISSGDTFVAIKTRFLTYSLSLLMDYFEKTENIKTALVF
jgi:hypothetical protein